MSISIASRGCQSLRSHLENLSNALSSYQLYLQMYKGWQADLGSRVGSQLLNIQKMTETKQLNHTAAANLYSLCCQQHDQGSGKRRLSKMDEKGFESWGLWRQLPAQGGLFQREDAVIYWTSAGDTDGTIVSGGSRGRSLLHPSLWQMAHKARMTVRYNWQLLHGWLFHKWGSFGTERDPKWKGQARTAMK